MRHEQVGEYTEHGSMTEGGLRDAQCCSARLQLIWSSFLRRRSQRAMLIAVHSADLDASEGSQTLQTTVLRLCAAWGLSFRHLPPIGALQTIRGEPILPLDDPLPNMVTVNICVNNFHSLT